MGAAERKLEYFAEVIAREVEARKRRAKHQTANDLSKKTAAALVAAEDRINAATEAARRDILRKSNAKVAAATAQAKAEFLSARDTARARMYEELANELKAFTRCAEYENYLIERINYVKTLAFDIVKLCPSDSHHAEAVAKATGLTIAENRDEFMGGFILQSKNGKILADHSFQTRLKRACAL
ncbi:MAG: hypothetical protein FWF79_01425 [Defluviitaleaceae bacterium]|nr:hypothetical protein [Defluviitaleaceae bacterium]